MKQIIFLLALPLIHACTTRDDTSASATPESRAVEERLTQYYKDMSNRDWLKYKTHFWENATITTAWQQPGDSIITVDVTTIDDFIKETPNGPDSQPIFEERMLGSVIRSEGDIAEAWVDYEVKFGAAANVRQWKGKDVFTFLRHNGEWKIVSIVFEDRD